MTPVGPPGSSPGGMVAEEFRRVFREEVASQWFQDAIREFVREELRPLKKRTDDYEHRFDKLEDMILTIADHLPGAIPDKKSYVRKKVEEAMTPYA